MGTWDVDMMGNELMLRWGQAMGNDGYVRWLSSKKSN